MLVTNTTRSEHLLTLQPEIDPESNENILPDYGARSLGYGEYKISYEDEKDKEGFIHQITSSEVVHQISLYLLYNS